MTDRHNGLAAARYAVLRDVESQAVDGVLERLRDAGIAAYVEPSPGRRGPYGDTILPSLPTDRLHVDADRVPEARGLVEEHLRAVQDEIAWAGIVAGFDAPTAEPVGRWPANEDVDEPPADRALPEAGFDALRDMAADPKPASDPTPAQSTPADPYAGTYNPAPYDEGHYVPPVPPPLETPDTIARFAWTGALGGPLLLFFAAATGIDLAGWVGVGALLAFVAGFVTLVARMKDRPPTDSGPDDGAVV
jgi:hypothetical protein